jgi:hypothetical protein
MTLLHSPQSTASLTPFLAIFSASTHSQRRWLSASHSLRAQAASAQKQPSVDSESRALADRLRRRVKTSPKTVPAQPAAVRNELPEPREFDLVGSTEAFYLNSKTKQTRLKELLSEKDVLRQGAPQKPAVEPSTVSKAVSAVRESIPFFGVKTDAAAKETEDIPEELDDAEVHTLYKARNTSPTTWTVGILTGLVAVFLAGAVDMAFTSLNLQLDVAGGITKYGDWATLLEFFAVFVLGGVLIGLYSTRVGLVEKIRFFPRREETKPWMRGKQAGKSRLAHQGPEGTLEVTSRSWMPYAPKTKTYEATEVWTNQPIVKARMNWEDSNGPMERLQKGELASGKKMGRVRTFMTEIRDVVMRDRMLYLYRQPSELKRNLTGRKDFDMMDLRHFNAAKEKGELFHLLERILTTDRLYEYRQSEAVVTRSP